MRAPDKADQRAATAASAAELVSSLELPGILDYSTFLYRLSRSSKV